MTTFDEKLAPLKAEIGELRAFLEHANEKYDNVLKKLKEQEKQNKEIIKENQFLRSTVKALDSHVRKLQVACNDLHQYSRRECLEILGIPVTEGEDTNMLVMKVGELMGVEIKEGNISVSHRLPTVCPQAADTKVKQLTLPLISNSFDVMLRKGIVRLENTSRTVQHAILASQALQMVKFT